MNGRGQDGDAIYRRSPFLTAEQAEACHRALGIPTPTVGSRRMFDEDRTVPRSVVTASGAASSPASLATSHCIYFIPWCCTDGWSCSIECAEAHDDRESNAGARDLAWDAVAQ